MKISTAHRTTNTNGVGKIFATCVITLFFLFTFLVFAMIDEWHNASRANENQQNLQQLEQIGFKNPQLVNDGGIISGNPLYSGKLKDCPLEFEWERRADRWSLKTSETVIVVGDLYSLYAQTLALLEEDGCP